MLNNYDRMPGLATILAVTIRIHIHVTRMIGSIGKWKILLNIYYLSIHTHVYVLDSMLYAFTTVHDGFFKPYT